MTKIEEVARAIHSEIERQVICTNDYPGGLVAVEGQIDPAALAIAAVSAMREPSEKMVDVAFDHPDQIDHQQSNVNDFIRQWRTAIDAALAEHRENT